MSQDCAMGENKSCWSDVAAVEAGHLQCFQGLSEAGCFLPVDSPDWASAGEARKLEIWKAAFTACKADHAPLLAWLFASGWPSAFDAKLPWHMGDMLETRAPDLVKEAWPVPNPWFPIGISSCATSSCLSWICSAKPFGIPRLRVWRCSWRQGAVPRGSAASLPRRESQLF
eukprot:jgi/Botrbrau1/1668/Bobra.116_2s0012.1